MSSTSGSRGSQLGFPLRDVARRQREFQGPPVTRGRAYADRLSRLVGRTERPQRRDDARRRFCWLQPLRMRSGRSRGLSQDAEGNVGVDDALGVLRRPERGCRQGCGGEAEGLAPWPPAAEDAEHSQGHRRYQHQRERDPEVPCRMEVRQDPALRRSLHETGAARWRPACSW